MTAEPRGVIIDKFLTPMKVLKGKTPALRLLSVRTNIGNVHHYLIHHTAHSLDRAATGPDYDMSTKSEQRFAQLLQQITKVTQRDIGCRHRSVYMNVPKIVELNNNTRLISVVSLNPRFHCDRKLITCHRARDSSSRCMICTRTTATKRALRVTRRTCSFAREWLPITSS